MVKVRFIWLGLAVLLGLGGWLQGRAGGAGSLADAPDISWAAPKDAHLHSFGAVNRDLDAQDNGCTEITYRLSGDLSKQTHQGCFVRVAFGWYDERASMVIFGSTDEAMSLYYGSSPAAVSAIPRSILMGRFGGNPPVGAYYYLYKNLPAALQEERFYPSLKPYKLIANPPDDVLRDPHGDPLAINGGALAYANGGQWMVTEAPGQAMLRINLATLQMQPFGRTLDDAGRPYASHSAKMAITEDGRYAAVVSLEYKLFQVYDLKKCTPTDKTLAMLAPDQCLAHNYWSWIEGKAGSITGVTNLNFGSDSLLNFDLTSGSQTTHYALSPDGAITSLIPYLGMGDSYSSGEGASNYLTGTDTAVNRCHLSMRSYPLLLNQDSFGGGGHSVACSGATSADLGRTDLGYTGQTKDQRPVSSRLADGSIPQILQNFTPGYVAQQAFVKAYRPGVVTVGMGGNDIGFADIILRCVSPLNKVWKPEVNEPNCYAAQEDRLELKQTIDGHFSDWVALYRQLQKANPAGRIYAVSYPYITAASGRCGLNVRLSQSELLFTRQVVDYLNQTIARAAAVAGVSFVDISSALAGHELCSPAADAMNGLTAGTDEIVISHGSYHPTALGQYLMEQAILKATHNFTIATGPQLTGDSGGPLLSAPAAGRAVVTVVPTGTISPNSILAGGSLPVSVEGNTAGLNPGGSYQVRLDGQTIGGLILNNSGNGAGQAAIPANTTPGLHEVSIVGSGQSGQTIVITKIIYVGGSATDTDGDGLPDAVDSCPIVTNSGVDQDNDGVDDACDNTPNSSSTAGVDVGGATGQDTVAPPITTATVHTNSEISTFDPQIPTNSSGIVAINTTTIRRASGVLGVTSATNPKFIAARARPEQTTNSADGNTNLRNMAAPKTTSVDQKVLYPDLPHFPWQLWLVAVVGLVGMYQLLGWAADKLG